MRFHAALTALLGFLIGFVTCSTSVVFGSQLQASYGASLHGPQIEPESHPYQTSDYFEQAKPSRRPPVGFKAEWIPVSGFGRWVGNREGRCDSSLVSVWNASAAGMSFMNAFCPLIALMNANQNKKQPAVSRRVIIRVDSRH